MITAKYNFTLDELKAGSRISNKTRLWIRLYPLFFGIIFFSINLNDGWKSACVSGIIATVVFAIVCPFLFYWSFAWKLKKNPYFGQSVTWNFTEQGVEQITDGSEGKVAWQKIPLAVISPKGLFLRPLGSLFYWIPATAFASHEDFQTVCGYVRQSGIKVKTFSR